MTISRRNRYRCDKAIKAIENKPVDHQPLIILASQVPGHVAFIIGCAETSMAAVRSGVVARTVWIKAYPEPYATSLYSRYIGRQFDLVDEGRIIPF